MDEDANRLTPRKERIRNDMDELTGPPEDVLSIEALYELTLRHWRDYQTNKDAVLEALDDNSDGNKFYADRDVKQLDECVRYNFSDVRWAFENMERYLTKIDIKYNSIRKRIQKMNK